MKSPAEHPLKSDALTAITRKAVVRIKKADAEKQIVYGVVYAPGEIDSHGEFMQAETIEAMAHDFMRYTMQKGGETIDGEHDNVAIQAYPVESYIETKEGMDWPVGSWIMATKIEDPVSWLKVKTGLFNGYSFEAYVGKVARIVEVDSHADYIGKTSKSEGHDHVFFVDYDDQGRVIGGCTSYDAGHKHEIKSGTTTEFADATGIASHSHRLPIA